jgi:oligosaccharyltransferase complex subunit alpha (ribophorin I)
MRWSALPLALLGFASNVFATASFENTAIVRTIEPAGALVHVTTTYAVKSLSDNALGYVFALSEDDARKTSILDVRIKGASDLLDVKEHGVEE